MDKKWWKEAVVYQIYPKSFMDSNDDGIGDLKGIGGKLDYLKDLGVDVVWVCPFYRSPMVDNGYDISDYYAVDPIFGNMEDLESLIKEAKKRDIKILVDLVLNHTSSKHAWFQKALTEPDSKYRDYYIFREGRDGRAPGNWRGCFGGNVWEKAGDNLYYYHTFDKEQPDLNWENPQLRKELYDIIHFWLEKGVGGFRIDAITYIKKNQEFPVLPADGADGLAGLSYVSQNETGIDIFLHEMKECTYGKYDMLTVAEAPGVPYDSLESYIGKDGHFSMIFDFSYNDIDVDESSNWYVKKDWSMKDVRDAIFKSQLSIRKVGWGALYLENHDQPRCLNKYIQEEDIGYYSAAALAGMYFFLRGTPFIYQGQELGMTNAFFEQIEDTRDLASVDQYQRALKAGLGKKEALETANKRSRANTRTPMQWSSSKNAGFTQGIPWMAVNDNYQEINAEKQRMTPDSILLFYKKLIRLRKDINWKDVLVYGEISPRFLHDSRLIAYERSNREKKVLVITNFSRENISLEISHEQILLDSYREADVTGNHILLRAYEFVILVER